jgi:poly(A) polymerase
VDVHNPQRDFAVEVVRQLRDGGFAALWAGGCVRDLLMGREPDDYDVATSATPEQVRELFGKRRTLAVGESFGVVIVLAPRSDDGPRPQIEVATFRTEGPYLDGRRPQSVEFSTPELDARRRDFTINGMFYDPLDERVLDYVGGEHDLRDGILRAIGDPRARMAEDKLRMLRAVRFAAGLDFELEPATAAAVQSMAGEILVVSAERIAQELRKMLVNRHRRRAVRLCRQLGLLDHVLPEVTASTGVADDAEWTHTLDVLDALPDPTFELAAAALLHRLPSTSTTRRGTHDLHTVPAVCRRLKLSNQELEAIAWLVANQHALDAAPELPLAQLKRLLAHPLAGDLVKLIRAQVDAANADATAINFVETYLRTTPREEIDPPELLTGDDLICLGCRPGPHFKSLLTRVRDAQLEGRLATSAEAIEFVRPLLPSYPS